MVALLMWWWASKEVVVNPSSELCPELAPHPLHCILQVKADLRTAQGQWGKETDSISFNRVVARSTGIWIRSDSLSSPASNGFFFSNMHLINENLQLLTWYTKHVCTENMTCKGSPGLLFYHLEISSHTTFALASVALTIDSSTLWCWKCMEC